MKDNKQIKASPPLASLLRALNGVPNASMPNVYPSSSNVNSISESQTETKNFKKWFVNWRNEPAKTSKVVS